MSYSFTDCSLILRHPSLGILNFIGTGIGSVSVNMSGDRTALDVAADGRVMTSKIKNKTATMALQIQQNADICQKLLKWYNYLETAPSSEWALITGVLNSPPTHEQIVMTEMAFQKLPDKAFGAQGAQITYNFMIADCQQNVA